MTTNATRSASKTATTDHARQSFAKRIAEAVSGGNLTPRNVLEGVADDLRIFAVYCQAEFEGFTADDADRLVAAIMRIDGVVDELERSSKDVG